MIIRDIILDDVPSYQRLLNEVYQESGAYFVHQAPSFEKLCERVRQTMLGSSAHLIAEHNDEVLGWIDLTPYAIQGMRHCADVSLGVKMGLRRNGIGSQLLKEITKRAKNFGIEILHLEVFASNPSAIQMYQNHGFKVEGVRSKARKCRISGNYDDIVLMAKFL